jgi:hypothetical protein
MNGVSSEDRKDKLIKRYWRPGQSLETITRLARTNLRYLIYHISEYINDRRYGINTRTSFRGVQSLENLTVFGERAGANPYAPTPFGTIERVIKRIQTDRSQYTFIDYGSGKGRVILVAARYRFREVIGIEFAEELHRIAERNIGGFRRVRRSPVRTVLCDARTFELPAGPCILYFFNSFETALMKQVVGKVISSYLENPRHIMVAYYHPVVGNAFDAEGHFRHTQTITESTFSSLGHPRRYTVRIFETI